MAVEAVVRPVVQTAVETAAVEMAAVAVAAAAALVAVAVEAAVITNTADSPGTLLPPPPSCTTPWAPSAR